jgi:hypothetical protein
MIFLVVGLMSNGEVGAQCANPITPSCDVYKSCFAKYCPCTGQQTEYFLSYGLKYCEIFLNKGASLSDSGRKWRDVTLRCLQEKIVPHLDFSESPKCDCASMRSIALKSHVECYTQERLDICGLDLKDITTILGMIDTKDLISTEALETMCEIAKVCSQRMAAKAPFVTKALYTAKWDSAVALTCK